MGGGGNKGKRMRERNHPVNISTGSDGVCLGLE